MSIPMRRVGDNHALVLDINTDKSHLVRNDDRTNYLFTFDSSTNGMLPDGTVVCRLRVEGHAWAAKNELGIVTTPVNFNEMEGVFDVEADFLKQWLVLNGVEVSRPARIRDVA